MSHKFIRFLLIGGFATAIHYAMFAIGVAAFGLAPVPASSIGFVCSSLVNYYLNKRFTFQSTRAHRQALPRFSLTAAMGLAWNALLLAFFVRLGLFIWLSQLITTVIVLGWNFFINARWAFNRPSPTSTTD